MPASSLSASSSTGSSSSASTTPMVLTPDSTGVAPPPSTGKNPKAQRRQTAVYNPATSSLSSNGSDGGGSSGPTKPLKPFSRSAAKRESVLTLGSIEHLQHYFSQAGIASKRNPIVNRFRNQGLVPAIGGSEHVPLSPVGEDGSDAASLHGLLSQPPPIVQQQQPQPPPAPHVKTHQVHPDALRPEAIYDLTELVKAWSIPSPPHSTPTTPTDVLGLLKTTTRAIHSVRNYVLSLDDESTAAIRARHHHPPSSSTSEPLALIRRSALDVLTSLRDLEERARLPLSDDAYDAQSEGGGAGGTGSGSRIASPSPPVSDDSNPIHDPGITFSFVQINGKVESVPVWVNEDDFDAFDDGTETKKERWDQRLELGNGWLYRKDMTMDELGKERGIVEEYVKLVDEALFDEETGEQGEWNFDRARRKLAVRVSESSTSSSSFRARSRSKNRRVSAADVMASSSAAAHALFIDTSTGGRRRISTGILGLGKGVSEEPEAMDGIKEEAWGAIKEEDEAEDAGEETEEAEDDELPDWAQRTSFPNDDLGRAYTFLKYFLPQPYHYALVPPTDSYDLPPPSPSPHAAPDAPSTSPSRTNFLSCLSSGQLLCLAYNSCVRKSRHPWGFVSREGVHDVLGLEEKERARNAAGSSKSHGAAGAGWTFRRTDNLRLWVGALKLRYQLPIQMPTQVISALPPSLLQLPTGPSVGPLQISKSRNHSPTTSSHPPSAVTSTANTPTSTTGNNGVSKDKDKVNFDAKIVARREEGWEDMLESVLLRWVWKAIEERRKA